MMIEEPTAFCVRCENKVNLLDTPCVKIHDVGLVCEKCFGAVSMDLLQDVGEDK